MYRWCQVTLAEWEGLRMWKRWGWSMWADCWWWVPFSANACCELAENLLEVGNLYGKEWAAMGTFWWEPVWGQERQRYKGTRPNLVCVCVCGWGGGVGGGGGGGGGGRPAGEEGLGSGREPQTERLALSLVWNAIQWWMIAWWLRRPTPTTEAMACIPRKAKFVVLSQRNWCVGTMGNVMTRLCDGDVSWLL